MYRILLLLLLSCTACYIHHLRSDHQEQFDAAVVVRTKCGTGSGVIVGPDTVITAHHVIDCPGNQITVVMPDGVAYEALLDLANEKDDFARIHTVVKLKHPYYSDREFKLPRMEMWPPDTGNAEAGSIVCVVPGFPSRVRTCGKVIAFVDGFIFSTVAVTFGNSGSALYDLAGRFVGIVIKKSDSFSVATSIPGWVVRP